MTTRVRPITVMAAAAVVVMVLIGVFAWTRDDTTVVGQPATIPVDLDAQAEASVTTMSGTPTYVRGPDLDEPADTQAAWVLTAGGPDPAAVRRLADALGVSGDLRQLDGMWQIGADDGAHLKIQVSAGLAWDYTSGGIPAVAAVCAEPESGPTMSPPTNASDLPADAATTTTIATSGSAAADDGGCFSTPPLSGVPSAAEAEDAARDLLRRAGVDVGQVRVTATSDEWGARATASPVLGGTPTQGIDTVVVFGAESAITHASGVLGVAGRADAYPLIGIDAGIARLNEGRHVLHGFPLVPVPAGDSAVASDAPVAESNATYGPMPAAGATETTVPVTTVPIPDATPPCPMAPSGDSPVTTTTIRGAGDGDAGGSGSGPTGCSDGISPCAPCPSDAVCADGCSDPTCNPATCADPYPGPTVVPDPSDPSDVLPGPDALTGPEVVLTSVEVVLAAMRGTDGSIWLVPAYRFEAEDHAAYTVLAIDESFIAPASSPAIEPATDPTLTGTTGTVETLPPSAPDDACCPPTKQADGSTVQCMVACSPGSSAPVTSSGG